MQCEDPIPILGSGSAKAMRRAPASRAGANRGARHARNGGLTELSAGPRPARMMRRLGNLSERRGRPAWSPVLPLKRASAARLA